MRILAFLALLATLPAQAAELTIRLDGVKHEQGSLKIALFDRAETFRKEELSLARREVPARPGAVDVAFGEVPAGRYAVMAYHDEDGDGTMDRFMGMIPTEGYGLSNNPDVSGPPAFDECSFDLGGDKAEILVRMKY